MRRLLRLARSCFAMAGLTLAVVTVTPLVSWWGRGMAGPWHDPAGDVLIVLAGSLQDEGVMGASSYQRSVYAVLAYRQGGFREVVVTGGGNGGTPVAQLMRDLLTCRGIPPASIHVEPDARSTRENALLTKPIVDRLVGRKVLLTSDYHMARASRAFRRAGLDVETWPFPDAIKRGGSFQTRWSAFLDLAREAVALGYYAARGWI